MKSLIMFVISVILTVGVLASGSMPQTYEIRWDSTKVGDAFSCQGPYYGTCKTTRDGKWYFETDQQVTLVILNADYETAYSLVVNQEELSVTRPQVFGENITASDVSDLFGALAKASELRGLTIDTENFEYLPNLLTEIIRAIDRSQTFLARGRLLDNEVERLIAEAKRIETALSNLLVRIDGASGYEAHLDNLPLVRARVNDYSRFLAALHKVDGERKVLLEDGADADSVVTLLFEAGQKLDGVREIVRVAPNVKNITELGVPEELLPSFNRFEQDHKTTIEAFEEAVKMVRERVLDIEGGISELKFLAHKADDQLRSVVETFNQKYDSERHAWRKNNEIRVPLKRVRNQARVGIGIFGKPAPVRLTLTFSTPSGEPRQADLNSSLTRLLSSVLQPVEEAPEDSTFLGGTSYDVHQIYHFRFAAGAIFSTAEDRKFNLLQRTITETDSMGNSSELQKKEIIQTRDRKRQVQPVFNTVVYPWGKDLNADTYQGAKRWIPGLSFGLSLAEPSRHILAGVAFEPIPGMDIHFGGHWAKTEELLDGFEEGQLLNEKDSLPIRLRFNPGFYWGIGVDAAVFKKIFSGF